MEAQDPEIINDDIVLENDDEIALEQVILDVVNKNEKALNTLLASPWMARLLARLSRLAWTDQEVDADEHGRTIRDVVFDAIRSSIHTMKNRDHMRASLASWCQKTVINHCKNVHRHQTVEHAHWDNEAHEFTFCKRNGELIIRQYSDMLSQQEALEQQEQEVSKERLIARIRRELRRAVNSLTPEDRQRVMLWAAGNTLEQIAAEMESKKDAVQRREKKFLVMLVEVTRQAIIAEVGEEKAEEIGIDSILKGLLATRGSELRKLVAHSLQEAAQDIHAPRACF